MVEYILQNIEKMIKTNSILFLSAVQTAYTLHADINRPAQNRRQHHVRYVLWQTLVTYTVSEIETQFCQRDKDRLRY